MPADNAFHFSAKIWVYENKFAWYFVTLPSEIALEINENFGYLKHGWGSIAVRCSINEIVWETSIFPDKKSKSYLLPLKAKVRQSAKIQANDEIKVNLELKYAL